MLLRLDRLPENGIAPRVLLLHSPGSFFDIGEHFRFDGGGVGDNSLDFSVYLKHCAAARAGHLERRDVLRHHRIIPQNPLAVRVQPDGKNLEQVEHLPSQKQDRNDHHHDSDSLSEIHTVSVRLKAPRHQPKNIQGGEAKNQGPENVVDITLFAETFKHRQQEKLDPRHGLQPLRRIPGREAKSEVRETFMGTVFGALEEAELNPAKSTDITLFQSRSQPSA